MEVIDNKVRQRFELKAGDHIAVAYYKTANGVITFTHTEVPQELSGHGVGSRLARGTLEQVRDQGLKVIAQCPFIAAFIRKNPEFASLLA